MLLNQVLYFFALSIFILYVSYIWIKYGIQKSISDSYYRLPYKQKYLFTLFCFFIAVPVMVISGNILMFLAGSLIASVGAASAFKGNKPTKYIHMIGAYTGVGLSQISICVNYDLWYVTAIFISISGLLFILDVKNKIWWVELVAFSSVFYTLIVR